MEQDKSYRYESARRYYTARLIMDLLGDYVVDVAAGGLFNQLGRIRTWRVNTLEEGLARLDAIAVKRASRHYHPVQ